MYIPKHNLATDRNELIAFMRQYNFGAIITSKDDKPFATHLPFVIKEENDSIILLSHFAKANPQWKDITQNEVLVIFNEPHAFISTKHYDDKEEVPTWNYIAVHAYGKGQLLESDKEKVGVLESMMEAFEPEYKNQWQSLSEEYRANMLKGIVAFKIIVTGLQGKKKLSQNRTEIERERIIETLSHSPNETEREIGERMKNEKK